LEINQKESATTAESQAIMNKPVGWKAVVDLTLLNSNAPTQQPPKQDMSKVKCFLCGKIGHKAADCNENKTNFAGMVVEVPQEARAVRSTTEEWMIDSGASVHVTNDKCALTNKKRASKQIKLGDGWITNISCTGDLLLHTNTNKILKLTGVCYIPGFDRNLMSVQALNNNGNSVYMPHNGSSELPCITNASNKKKIEFRRGALNMIFLEATRFEAAKHTAFKVTHAGTKDNRAEKAKPKQTQVTWQIKPANRPNIIEHEEGELATPYKDAVNQGSPKIAPKRTREEPVKALDLDDLNGAGNPKKPKKSNRLDGRTMSIREAHSNFGHIGIQSLDKLAKAMNLKLTGEMKACSTCLIENARHSKTHKMATTERATLPGERWGIDLTGPFQEALNGIKYVAVSVDKKTNYRKRTTPSHTSPKIKQKLEMHLKNY